MKNRLSILFSGFMIMFAVGLFSCWETFGPYRNKFKIIGLDWGNYKAIYSDTSQTKLILDSIKNDTISYEFYSIRIIPRQETYVSQNTSKWNFNLIPSAYALSPPPPPTTDETIDDIVIESKTDFDLNHPSGTNLADLFDVVVYDYTNSIYYQKYDLKDYLATNSYVPDEIILILKGQPDVTSSFEFLVKYYQNGVDDNNYFEFTTNKIMIKRGE